MKDIRKPYYKKLCLQIIIDFFFRESQSGTFICRKSLLVEWIYVLMGRRDSLVWVFPAIDGVFDKSSYSHTLHARPLQIAALEIIYRFSMIFFTWNKSHFVLCTYIHFYAHFLNLKLILWKISFHRWRCYHIRYKNVGFPKRFFFSFSRLNSYFQIICSKMILQYSIRFKAITFLMLNVSKSFCTNGTFSFKN